MSAIELVGVSKRYGARTAVDRVSIVVEPGERVVLLGPSGCGKTTLLRLVAGLEVPDIGTIRLDGVAVAQEGRLLVASERRHIGMVLQDLALWPHMTVSEHLKFALRYASDSRPAERRTRIAEMLEMVRMTDRAGARPSELSGGQQQRGALARAIVASPGIVLMDEPLSSLDDALNRHPRAEILRLHAALAFTLVYVTHSLGEAAEIGSRVIALREGRLAEAPSVRPGAP